MKNRFKVSVREKYRIAFMAVINHYNLNEKYISMDLELGIPTFEYASRKNCDTIYSFSKHKARILFPHLETFYYTYRRLKDDELGINEAGEILQKINDILKEIQK